MCIKKRFLSTIRKGIEVPCLALYFISLLSQYANKHKLLCQLYDLLSLCFTQIDTNQGRYVLTAAGDLTIVQVRQTDSGSYVCVASNGLGEPVSREVQLAVTGMNFF